MNEEWLNNLRNKIEQHTEPAPEGLWEEIEHELFPEETRRFVFLKPDIAKAKESGSVFKKYLGTVAKVASVILLTLFTKDIVNQSSVKMVSVGPKTLNKGTEKKMISSMLVTHKELQNTQSEKRIKTEEPIKDEVRILTNDLALLESKIEFKEEGLIAESQKMIFPKNESKEVSFQKNSYPAKKRFVAGILTGQISSSSAEQHPGFTTMTAKPLETQSILQENKLLAIVTRNSNETVYTDINHKSPVTVGVSLLYHLDSKLSIGSGLVYTKLVSELQAGSKSDYISSRQTLHYLGVPLHFNYSMFESKGWGAYVSSGATIGKNIGGTTMTQYTLNPIREAGPKKKLTDKTVQLSVNALMGVQYKINPQLGIYLEPGINYYVPNKSELSTLFKEKPLMFNTRMGLRFTLNK